MSTFYGENIHSAGVKDVAALLTHVHKTQPSWTLVMDGLDLCKQILVASPTTNVIHRNYAVTDGDDNVFARIAPARWLELRAAEADAGVWLHTTCEPGWSQQVIDWHLELMRLCIPRKIKLVVGNWSVGTPDPKAIVVATTLLEMLDEYRDQFVLGLHEYANAVITSGLVGGAPNGKTQEGKVVHPDYVAPASWPLDGEAKILTHWHMGRYKFWVEYCKSVKITPPRMVLTEVGFDDVSDIDWWTKTLPHTNLYTNIGGFKTLQAYWTRIFPDWSEDRAYYEQLKYAEHNVYQDSPVEGGCVYCLGHIDKRWESDDIEEHTEFLSYLEADALTHTMTPNYTPAPFVAGGKYKISCPGTTRNIRANAGIGTGAFVGQVADGTEIVALEQVVVSIDYWWKITTGSITGYVSLDGNRVQMIRQPDVIELPPPSDPPPVVPPTPKTGYVPNAAQVAAFEAWRVDLMATIATNATKITDLNAENTKLANRMAAIDDLLASLKV